MLGCVSLRPASSHASCEIGPKQMISEKLSDQKNALKSTIFMLKYFFKNFSRPKFCDRNAPGVRFTPRFQI